MPLIYDIIVFEKVPFAVLTPIVIPWVYAVPSTLSTTTPESPFGSLRGVRLGYRAERKQLVKQVLAPTFIPGYVSAVDGTHLKLRLGSK